MKDLTIQHLKAICDLAEINWKDAEDLNSDTMLLAYVSPAWRSWKLRAQIDDKTVILHPPYSVMAQLQKWFLGKSEFNKVEIQNDRFRYWDFHHETWHRGATEFEVFCKLYDIQEIIVKHA